MNNDPFNQFAQMPASIGDQLNPVYLLKIIQTAMDAIISIDQDQNIILFNAAAEAMFGYNPREVLGKPLSLLLPPRYREPHLGQVERFGATHHTRRSMGRLGRVYGSRAGGEEFPAEAAISSVSTEHGTVYTVIVRDISERIRAEEALRAVNEQLAQRIAEVESLQEELRQQALHDSLTGLYNRRYLSDLLPREIARADRAGEPISLIIADVDHFKRFNDQHGHAAGDHVLMEIASLLKDCVRASDFVCRFGGEEFVIVMPGAPQEFASRRAEEIRQRCAGMAIDHAGAVLKVAMSMGLAAFPDHGSTPDQLIRSADRALYHSKQTGRNRVTSSDELLPSSAP